MKKFNFPYEAVLVLGLARSGTAAAKLLLKNGKRVRINDLQEKADSAISKELSRLGAELILGSHPLSVLDDIDIIVKNPGIPYENPVLVEAMKRNILIVTEIELAYELVAGKLIGVTGSNGKTTTTMLTAEMMKASKLPVQAAGNIGVVATEVAQTLTEEETMVLELSSFQLQGTERFRPNIAVLLNLYPAHLDYHHTLENYHQAKFNIFRNQTRNDYFVYNANDAAVVKAAKQSAAALIPFSTKEKLENGAWADADSIFFRTEKIIDRAEIVLVGDHNLENILAATAAAKLAGATNEGIRNVLTSFTGVKHRLQFVLKKNNRLFYNDSKATNMLATEKALRAFQQPVILLAGGLDRGDDFRGLIPYFEHVKGIISFGETKEKIQAVAKEANISLTLTAKNVEEAVNLAYEHSEENDVVLLSPACASWDQYRTFEERGDMFIQAVHNLL